MDSCQTLVMYVSCRADELIRFWGHKVKGQRSQGSLCMQKQLVIALSEEPIDGFSCQTLVMYVSCRTNELIRFWVMRSKVKDHGLIMYAKIACERILIRTDRWITI